MMEILLNAVFFLMISTAIGFAIYFFLKNVRDKKTAQPIYKLSYSSEYTQKNFWTNEIVLFLIITEGLAFLAYGCL